MRKWRFKKANPEALGDFKSSMDITILQSQARSVLSESHMFRDGLVHYQSLDAWLSAYESPLEDCRDMSVGRVPRP